MPYHFFSFRHNKWRRRRRRRRRRNFHQIIILAIPIIILSAWCGMQSVAFVDVIPVVSNRRSGSTSTSTNRVQVLADSPRSNSNSNSNSNTQQQHVNNIVKRKSSNNIRQQQRFYVSEFEWVVKKLDDIQSPVGIEDWIVQQQQQQTDNSTSFLTWTSWNIQDQVHFIKYLQQRHAYSSILLFLSMLDFDGNNDDIDDNVHIIHRQNKKNNDRSSNHVKVYTTALFVMSSITEDHNYDRKKIALKILDQMYRNQVTPTTLTYVAVFRNVQGNPKDVLQMVRYLEKGERESGPKIWNAEVYYAAIYACRIPLFRRTSADKENNNTDSTFMKEDAISNSNEIVPNNKDWQTALSLMQQMQRKGIEPTSKIYLAVLDVLAQNPQKQGKYMKGKLTIIRSLIRQYNNSRKADYFNDNDDDRIWATALNACAVVGDYAQSLQLLQEMMSSTCTPNLRHCTALLKAFAKAPGGAQDNLAMTALNAMMGNMTAFLEIPGSKNDESNKLLLPQTDLDLVALNTVLSVLNFDDAQQLFGRIQMGEFMDLNAKVISPDRITYHNLLVGCEDPETASKIVNQMRLSRRNRYGAIPPTAVTYAHAINVCQRAKIPDLKTANQLINWAKDDRIQPTVFIFASAIWTAQRCGDLSRCLELYEEMERMGCTANGVVLNGILSALCDNGMYTKALEIFDLIKDRGFQVSAVGMKRLVFATIQSSKEPFAEDKETIFLRILRRLDPHERQLKISGPVFEALISLYGSIGDIEQVLHVKEQINGCLDAACLRATLLSYTRCSKGRWPEAVELLHTTIVEGSPTPERIDQIALSNVLLVCSRADEYEDGLSLLNLYGIPTNKLPRGSPCISIVALNALIAACGRGGRPDLSLSLLNEISYRYRMLPDSRSYRSAIIACNKAQHAVKVYDRDNSSDKVYGNNHAKESSIEWWECSLALFRRMTEEGLTPDVQTHSSIISSCEAAGEWQRALWVLQTIIDNSAGGSDDNKAPSSLNLYCWNAAISACEKGGAWVEALDLYERMLETESFKPNVVTMNSLMEALDNAGQKELQQSMYSEGVEEGLVDPWNWTKNKAGEPILALDLHTFSAPMAKAAIRKIMDSWLDEKDNTGGGLSGDLVIITGKGKHSVHLPVLQRVTKCVLLEYGIKAEIDKSNNGRIVVTTADLMECFSGKSWS
jgi:pentatricopeptide repeat protein